MYIYSGHMYIPLSYNSSILIRLSGCRALGRASCVHHHNYEPWGSRRAPYILSCIVLPGLVLYFRVPWKPTIVPVIRCLKTSTWRHAQQPRYSSTKHETATDATGHILSVQHIEAIQQAKQRGPRKTFRGIYCTEVLGRSERRG